MDKKMEKLILFYVKNTVLMYNFLDALIFNMENKMCQIT